MNCLYPFDRHYLDLDGIRLHYLDEGPADAEPIVMLHGNPTWSFYYRNLVLALRDRYRCIEHRTADTLPQTVRASEVGHVAMSVFCREQDRTGSHCV